MSRNKRRGGTASPIKKYLEFSGSTGVFSYYNKETKSKVEVEELEIIVLDVRASITGYNSGNKSSIASNMVAETGKETMKVIAWKDGKATDIAEGLYKEIKAQVKEAGGKFTSNIICLVDVGDGQEICNLQVKGSSLNGWINFLDTLERDGEYDNVITISKGALSKVDGKNFVPVTKKEEDALDKAVAKNKRHPQPIWFFVLAFEVAELTEADTATEQDEVVQSYFSAVGGVKAESDTESNPESGDSEAAATPPEDTEESEKEDLPF